MDCEIVWGDVEPTHIAHLERAVASLPRETAQDYLHFSQWVMRLMERYPGLVNLRIIDAISVEGIAKSHQFGINFYPAVIINHHALYSWQNLDRADQAIEEIVRAHECEEALVPC